MSVNIPARWRLGLVSQILESEGVIACPTEGVWGLSCLPDSAAAVARILRLKQRDWRAGLLIVASDIDQLDAAGYLGGISASQRKTLEEAWPGPVSFLVPDTGAAPAWIVGKHKTLGLRVTAHPLLRALCDHVGPIVSTSANLSGRPAATTSRDVHRYFGPDLDYLLPGKLGGRQGPSEIRVLDSGEVIR